MKPISEISPVIQGPYREIHHKYLTYLHKLSDRAHNLDPEITKLEIKVMKDLSNHFRESLDFILNKLIAKKLYNPSQAIYDHFSIWLTFINSFKKHLITGDIIKLARESKGKATNIVLDEYDAKIKELNSTVEQIQSLIETINQSINNPLYTKKDYGNLKKELANILVSDILKSLFRTLIEDVNKLKILPALEATSIVNYDYIQEWDLTDAAKNNLLNASDNSSSYEEPTSNNDNYDSDSDSLTSLSSTGSDIESNSPRISQKKSSIRPRAANITEPFDPIKYEIYKLTKEIAQRKSEGKILGIARIEITLSKLTNTEELIKYREQQEQYWKTYYADKKPQAANSSRKLI